MSSTLILLLLVLAVVLLWLDGARARELATAVVDELCRRRGYQRRGRRSPKRTVLSDLRRDSETLCTPSSIPGLSLAIKEAIIQGK